MKGFHSNQKPPGSESHCYSMQGPWLWKKWSCSAWWYCTFQHIHLNTLLYIETLNIENYQWQSQGHLGHDPPNTNNQGPTYLWALPQPRLSLHDPTWPPKLRSIFCQVSGPSRWIRALQDLLLGLTGWTRISQYESGHWGINQGPRRTNQGPGRTNQVPQDVSGSLRTNQSLLDESGRIKAPGALLQVPCSRSRGAWLLGTTRALQDESGSCKTNQGTARTNQSPARRKSGPHRTNQRPADETGPRRTNQGSRSFAPAGSSGRTRALQDESGPHRTNQGPARRIRAPQDESDPMGQIRTPRDEPERHKTNQGPAGRIRAPWNKPGPRRTNQSPVVQIRVPRGRTWGCGPKVGGASALAAPPSSRALYPPPTSKLRRRLWITVTSNRRLDLWLRGILAQFDRALSANPDVRGSDPGMSNLSSCRMIALSDC